MREWLTRLWDWLHRDQLDRELTEELRFHRAQLEGAAPDDAARWAAARRLGNVTGIREAARERWSWPWLDTLQQDVRYAIRGLRRSPGFTMTVMVTLGLGIGANAAMFGLLDRLMLRPFPYLADPRMVHRIFLQQSDRGRLRLDASYEYARALDLRRWTSSFDRYAFVFDTPLPVGSGDRSRELRVAAVSASFFELFRARPVLGRYFGAAEDTTPMGAPVVVLSYAFWQSEYGGRNVLGQILPVGNVPSTIIGVAPRGFVGVTEGQAPVAFLPITTFAGSAGGPDDRVTYYTQYHWGWMRLLVRRKPGVDLAAATADLSAAYRRSWDTQRAQEPELTPKELARPAVVLGPLKSAAGPQASLEAKTLRWVMGVALIVLLIACANVTNLLFARVLRRRRETAVRLALGVSRARLVGQSVIESLLLASLGCLAGLAVAQWGGIVLRRLFLPPGTALDVLTDWRTVMVASALALVAGLLTGLAPALLVSADGLAGTLKAGAREGGYQRSRLRSALLIVQGALSVVLLVGALLFVRSLNHVRAMRLGYDPDPVLFVRRSLRSTTLADSTAIALSRRMLETARALPEVREAALVSSVPFWSTSGTSLYVAGIDTVRQLGRFTYQSATPGYFAAMDTRILRGRAFTEQDRAGSPRVAVVSAAMAQVLWPGREAIGQCMRVERQDAPCTTVIGIAEDAVQNSLTGDDQRFRYYLPLDQFRPQRGWGMLLRMRGDPALQGEPVRRALQRLMPGDAYISTMPLGEILANQRRSWRLGATMFVAFGGLALLVAAIGLYGVITYTVAQRSHELGVRIALGAQARDVVRLVVGQGVRFAVAGVALGTGAVLLLGKFIQPLLFEQSARDPRVMALVAGLLLLVAVLASAGPARRATRADPNAALRSD